MSVIDDLNTTWEEKAQREAAFKARKDLVNCTDSIEQTHQAIQAIVDSGKFDTIPTDLKQVLNQWWTIIKAARTSIGTNSDIVDVYTWRP